MNNYLGFTQAQLLSAMDYNPVTGVLTRRKNGKQVVKSPSQPYVKFKLGNVLLYAHRAAFLMAAGYLPAEIDHINHDSCDNRWCNLRPATRSTNAKNRGMNRNNTSGFCGVRWFPPTRKWRAQIKSGGVQMFLGDFVSKEGAIAARLHAEREYAFHENHGDRKEQTI